jgi:hypothetical protein
MWIVVGCPGGRQKAVSPVATSLRVGHFFGGCAGESFFAFIWSADRPPSGFVPLVEDPQPTAEVIAARINTQLIPRMNRMDQSRE